MNVIEGVMNLVQEEAKVVREFATEPVGIFETIDKAVKTARRTIKETITGAGAPIGGKKLIGGGGSIFH